MVDFPDSKEEKHAKYPLTGLEKKQRDVSPEKEIAEPALGTSFARNSEERVTPLAPLAWHRNQDLLYGLRVQEPQLGHP
jgi:hypothetical protein